MTRFLFIINTNSHFAGEFYAFFTHFTDEHLLNLTHFTDELYANFTHFADIRANYGGLHASLILE